MTDVAIIHAPRMMKVIRPSVVTKLIPERTKGVNDAPKEHPKTANEVALLRSFAGIFSETNWKTVVRAML